LLPLHLLATNVDRLRPRSQPEQYSSAKSATCIPCMDGKSSPLSILHAVAHPMHAFAVASPCHPGTVLARIGSLHGHARAKMCVNVYVLACSSCSTGARHYYSCRPLMCCLQQLYILLSQTCARCASVYIHPCPVFGAALVRTEMPCTALEHHTRRWVDMHLRVGVLECIRVRARA